MNSRNRWIAVMSLIAGAVALQGRAFADDAAPVAPPENPSVTTAPAEVAPPPATTPPVEVVTPPPVIVTQPPVVVTNVPSRDLYYPSDQLKLDLFGTYASRNRFGDSGDRWGGGAGLDYFFSRYFGIGADTYIEEWKLPYRVNGSAIIRLPLPDAFSRIALYGIGGGGREFKYVPQYTWHGGGGAEFKLSPNTGIFGDIREVFPDKTGDYVLIRAGLSFGF